MLVLCVFLSLAVVGEAKMEGFIVGGSFTTIKKHPYSAFMAVRCVDDFATYYLCGSSILNQGILLTAAHCIHLCVAGTTISITVGHTHKQQGTVISASKYVWHENFNLQTLEFDVGLVKTLEPIQFSAKTSRVAIVPDPPYNEPVMVAGWGYTDFDNKLATIVLKELPKRIMKTAYCEKIVGYLGNGLFCAKNKDQGNIAEGDSGSGLMVRGYIQIGIVSGTMPTPDLAIGIYTDVGYHYDWITQHAEELHCNNS